MKGATLFTGGGGVDLGMQAAGIETVWGIECDAHIAEVARRNGVPATVADILEARHSDFSSVDYLHASPPCPNFSVAKTGAAETELDIALSEAVCGFIANKTPRFFTLENVSKYQYSRSFAAILRTLARLGYMFSFSILNAADFGVPQTRRRLWLIASRDGLVPYLPRRVPWLGWYEAIADLVPSLPDSQFAPWQLERMREITDTILVGQDYDAPTGSEERHPMSYGVKQPSFTIKASASNGLLRTFIVDGQNSRIDGELTIRDETSPVFTVAASTGHRPANAPRAAVPGRVVAMTPRCLARFQSFPDSYELPDNNALACRIIGNAVPPLLAQKIYEILK